MCGVKESCECFLTVHESWSTFLCCEFYNAIVLVFGERRVKGLVTAGCSLASVPIVSGANCSYKEIWPDHLTTKLVSYQIPVPHLRSDCLLIYIYSLMT